MAIQNVLEISCDWCGESETIPTDLSLPAGWVETRLTIKVDPNYVTPAEFQALKKLSGTGQYCCSEHLCQALKQNIQRFLETTGQVQEND